MLAVGLIDFAYLVNISGNRSVGPLLGRSADPRVQGLHQDYKQRREILDPYRNVGRMTIISIAICVMVYLPVAFAVGLSLSLEKIVAAKDEHAAYATRSAQADGY